jgi:hypothetical protein
MKAKTPIIAVALVFAALLTSVASSQGKLPYPDALDATHATKKAAAFFTSFFTAKSKHDVAATMKHFSKGTLTYVDATLGWPFMSHDALKGVFDTYMPKWPASGLSYPTRILGDEKSALVAFTDTPELFGGEIRILAAVDLKDGKVVRWVDYWDSRHFGVGLAHKLRTPADKFPTDLKEGTAPANASAKIREAATKLHAALANNDAKAAAALFSEDAAYEDMTLHAQVLGRLAIQRYLGRVLVKHPGGAGSSLLHVVGGELGGGFEWQASPNFKKTVRRGITALELDKDGKITRLTSVWDGAMIMDTELKTLIGLSFE